MAAGVDVFYLSSNTLTATVTQSSDSAASTGATVTMDVYAKGSSGTLVLDGVSLTGGTSGEYSYVIGSTVLAEQTVYIAEVTAVIAASTSQRYAEVPLRVVTDKD